MEEEMSTGFFPSKESKSKREMLLWTPKMDSIFIESMLFQHREGNHEDGVFSSYAYADMLKIMTEKFPSMNITKQKLKNRLKTLKHNFSKCYDVFRTARNNGFSWNNETKIWGADPEVWHVLIQSKPEAAEWKTKKIYNYDRLEELFAKDRATSETAKEKKRRRAKTKVNSVCDDNTKTIDDINIEVSHTEYNLENFSIDLKGDDIEISPIVETPQVPSQSVRSASISRGKRKEPETMEEVLKISLREISNAIERSTNAILESSASLGKFRARVFSFEEITQELVEMGVKGKFFDDAFEILTDNPEKAKKLFAYPKSGRLSYLKKLVYSI